MAAISLVYFSYSVAIVGQLQEQVGERAKGYLRSPHDEHNKQPRREIHGCPKIVPGGMVGDNSPCRTVQVFSSVHPVPAFFSFVCFVTHVICVFKSTPVLST